MEGLVVFYVFLIAASVAIAASSFLLWSKTRNFSVVVGIFLVYYFTLYGAWEIVADGINPNDASKNRGFHYLYKKLFKVELDEYYFWSLVLYALFILIIIWTLFFCLGSYRKVEKRQQSIVIKQIIFPHKLLLVFCAMFSAIYLFGNIDFLKEAFVFGTSAYGRQRTEVLDGPLSIAGNMGFLSSAIGFSVYCCRDNTFYFRNRIKKMPIEFEFLGYVLILGGFFLLDLLLGNKGRLLQGSILGSLFYMQNCSKSDLKRLSIIVVTSFAFISLISVFRSMDPNAILNNLDPQLILDGLDMSARSNEKVAAHISMYGVLKYRIDYTYGSSLLFLVLALLPRFLVSDRPPEIYEFYAKGVSAPDNQGFTIHHATGWYLNFGIFGVVAGAILLGILWAIFINQSYRSESKGLFLRLVSVIAPSVFVSLIPMMMRGGPEVYRPLMIDIILSSSFLIYLACRLTHRKQAKLMG
jgi:hypothetical protein